jgi:hypothetical protein
MLLWLIALQAIKQKLQIKMNRTLGPLGAAEEAPSPQEEDKARMLFGARMMVLERFALT